MDTDSAIARYQPHCDFDLAHAFRALSTRVVPPNNKTAGCWPPPLTYADQEDAMCRCAAALAPEPWSEDLTQQPGNYRPRHPDLFARLPAEFDRHDVERALNELRAAEARLRNQTLRPICRQTGNYYIRQWVDAGLCALVTSYSRRTGAPARYRRLDHPPAAEEAPHAP